MMRDDLSLAALPSRLGVRGLLYVLWVVLFCCACTTPTEEITCNVDGDCPTGSICEQGRCQEVPAQPVADRQIVSFECQVDNDCEGSARCVDGQCFDNQCEEGALEACMNECGTGTRRCEGGVWRACSAQSTLEICGDGIDQDCDGTPDENCEGCMGEETRPCRTECGEGQEYCVDNQWRGCTATAPRDEVCGDEEDQDCDGQIDEGCANCADGDRRPCETACGRGEETCRDKTWRDCNAPQPLEEVCDRQDNDCDMRVDELLTRSCDNHCGAGSESCSDGSWVNCNAPAMTCACDDERVDRQVCQLCGVRERLCDPMGFWAEWGDCVEDPAVVQCQPGDVEEGPCGDCGRRRRVCGSGCTWEPWQECSGEGVCTPEEVQSEACPGEGCGERRLRCTAACEWEELQGCGMDGPGEACEPGSAPQEEACGRCGTKVRSCEGCRWGDWSPCMGEGVCDPASVEEVPCENACTVQQRVCTDECQWGPPDGMCVDAACEMGEVERRPCGERCGEESRVCDGCNWGPWSGCEGEGVCSPGEEESRVCGSDVGRCQEGREQRRCQDDCSWSSFGECEGGIAPSMEICGSAEDEDCDGTRRRAPDEYENNDSCDRCTLLSAEVDPVGEIIATLDSVEDRKDYYCFDADDSTFNIFENIELDLTNVPLGVDYDLYLYAGIENCNSGNSLANSIRAAGESESIRWGERVPGDNNGRYYIEVRRLFGHSCEIAYRLRYDGLN